MAGENNEHVDAADTATLEVDDPLAEIRNQDEQWVRDGIETALSAANGNSSDSESQDEEDTSSEEDSNVARRSKDTSSDEDESGEKRSGGISAALKLLEDSDPKLAEAVRSQITRNNNLQERINGIESKMEDVIAKAVSEALAEQNGSDDDSDEDAYSPEQVEAAKDRLRKMGVVLAEDLEAKETEKTHNQYLADGRKAAVDEFGEKFGTLADDGTVQLAEGVQEKLSEVGKRISKFGTLNLHDLYVLSHHKDLLEDAEQRGFKRGQTEKVQKTEVLRKANTENGSSAVDAAPTLRGKAGTESDSVRNIVARSFLKAKKELGL